MTDPTFVPAPQAKTKAIYYNARSYSAFPHLLRLGQSELLLAFRQAPRQEVVRHTHPRSTITVMRSYDLGKSWDVENATHVGSGGSAELSLLHLGGPMVGGALAWQQVAPDREAERTGFPKPWAIEYPTRTASSLWIWSETWGLTWQPHHVSLVGPGTVPCAPPIALSDGTILYPAYGNAQSQDMSRYSSYCYFSRDQGKTWSAPTVIAQGDPATRTYAESMVIETAPGQLRALHRIEDVKVGTRGTFWTNHSPDGGKTWSPVRDTGILSGACPRLMKLQDGRLLLTFGRRFEPFAILAMFSTDGGETWGDNAWVLSPCRDGNQGYTSSVELAGGKMFTANYAGNSRGVTGIVGIRWKLPR